MRIEGTWYGPDPGNPKLIECGVGQYIGSELYYSTQYVSWEQFKQANVDIIEEALKVARRLLWMKARELATWIN